MKERDIRDVIPEVLSAAGCAAIYCAQADVWPEFEQWLTQSRYLTPDEKISREFMVATAKLVASLIRDIETELIATKFQEYLKEQEADKSE